MPDWEPKNPPASDGFNHVWLDEERPCWDCGEPTRWCELAFEAPLHPGPCTDRKYRELEEADRQAEENQAAREKERLERLPEVIEPGTRKTENGQTLQWTGALWRLVPASELDTEKRRQR